MKKISLETQKALEQFLLSLSKDFVNEGGAEFKEETYFEVGIRHVEGAPEGFRYTISAQTDSQFAAVDFVFDDPFGKNPNKVR